MGAVTSLVSWADASVTEREGLRRVRLTATRWRVTQPNGAIVGYLDALDERWRAVLLRRDRQGLSEFGVFDSFEAAFDALRLS